MGGVAAALSFDARMGFVCQPNSLAVYSFYLFIELFQICVLSYVLLRFDGI